ncbi:MAG: hypothetical protein IKJ49_07180 [Bacteroidaceae bacterium]|nr:hypothetical protein [Bacteroidaceae bacterium]
MNKRTLTILLTILAFIGAYADNGINSPYSRYGVGILSNQSLGINRQMGGLGYGLRSRKYINIVNPASFSEADTLTMLFEAGISLQNINFKEGDKKINAKNASFDYLAMQFRIRKNLGMSIGFLPYSRVGYSFSKASGEGTTEASIDSYNGTGGIYQPYIGIAWRALPYLSFGLTASYIYGDITHNVGISFLNSTGMQKTYDVSVNSYKLDLGVQYITRIGEKHGVTVGAVYSIGHKMSADATLTEANSSSTKEKKIKNGFRLPHTFGLGFIYSYDYKWKFGADYTFQNWNSSTFFGDAKGTGRSKASIGVEYSPTKLSNNIFKMIEYRAGAYYAQPYTKIKGEKGCNEYGISAGISLPFYNNNNRYSHATLHISGEFAHAEPKASGMIAENYFRINVGITFNESWFTKMRIR